MGSAAEQLAAQPPWAEGVAVNRSYGSADALPEPAVGRAESADALRRLAAAGYTAHHYRSKTSLTFARYALYARSVSKARSDSSLDRIPYISISPESPFPPRSIFRSGYRANRSVLSLGQVKKWVPVKEFNAASDSAKSAEAFFSSGIAYWLLSSLKNSMQRLT